MIIQVVGRVNQEIGQGERFGESAQSRQLFCSETFFCGTSILATLVAAGLFLAYQFGSINSIGGDVALIVSTIIAGLATLVCLFQQLLRRYRAKGGANLLKEITGDGLEQEVVETDSEQLWWENEQLLLINEQQIEFWNREILPEIEPWSQEILPDFITKDEDYEAEIGFSEEKVELKGDLDIEDFE